MVHQSQVGQSASDSPAYLYVDRARDQNKPFPLQKNLKKRPLLLKVLRMLRIRARSYYRKRRKRG